jgi:hypothetical protein
MSLLIRLFLYISALFLVVGMACQKTAQAPLGNLAHLDSLCEDVVVNGQPCTIVHIYADAPNYAWTDASGEGVACIDDVARAAVVYMKAYEGGYDVSLDRINRLLRFVLVLQADDGEFYNFVNADMSINKIGVTSKKDFAFWAARGYWALGYGYRFFRNRDAQFAEELETAFLKCTGPIDNLLIMYDKFVEKNGRRYPQWLMIEFGSDATSELLLGITSYLQEKPHPQLAERARKLADGILAMQVRDHAKMNGAIESWPGWWHAWGNTQVQALAELALILDDSILADAVQSSADFFLGRLAAGKMFSVYNFEENEFTDYPQIAYDIRTTSLGLIGAYKVTGDENYASLAGLSASWLTGNNIAKASLYDKKSGRIYDGIDKRGVNQNSGAESTIEGLYILLEVEKVKSAREWLYAKNSSQVVSFFEEPAATNEFTTVDKKLTATWNREENKVELNSNK